MSYIFTYFTKRKHLKDYDFFLHPSISKGDRLECVRSVKNIQAKFC